jgi:hypothetical protein
VWFLVTGRSTPQRLPTLQARSEFRLRDMHVCEQKPGAALDLTPDEKMHTSLFQTTPQPTEASCVGPEDNRSTKVQLLLTLLSLRATLIERSSHASGQVSSDRAVHLVDVLDEHRCGEQSHALLPLLCTSSLSLVLLFSMSWHSSEPPFISGLPTARSSHKCCRTHDCMYMQTLVFCAALQLLSQLG